MNNDKCSICGKPFGAIVHPRPGGIPGFKLLRVCRCKSSYKHMNIKEMPIPEGRKTGIFFVESKNGDKLGEIKWYGCWRQYCFYPEGETIYSRGCLDDICDFIRTLMLEWNLTRQLGRNT